ncbi:hypothetical protein [Aquimarina sp. RZ0]|uniref:hypothetical protein n=1 Tax=Aquimarina sp. RZ0 TaxID=2607730 RepID=UPI0011F1AAE3|nr:hypothetical protein [Aquimarina sp. RZ0]KAA1246822.1 hypothetical protein F0000_06065 [Aquimarina sp. RZ0]
MEENYTTSGLRSFKEKKLKSFSFKGICEEINLNLSYSLLEKQSLLTPSLIENFGEIYVLEKSSLDRLESDKTYLRISEIRQKKTNYKLLDASLRIFKKSLPIKLINSLQTMDTPFGSLLKQNNIQIEVNDLHISLHQNINTEAFRLGRNYIMTDKNTNKKICYVREILVEEMFLLRANIE